MAVDVSGLLYFMPIFSFLFVFLVVYALLTKSKVLSENPFINVLVGFIVATAFVTASTVREYAETVTPWFGILVLALFFILAIIGFSQQKLDGIIGKNLMLGFVAIIILVFLFSGIKVFSSILTPIYYRITDSERLLGGILVFFVASLTAWVVTKK